MRFVVAETNCDRKDRSSTALLIEYSDTGIKTHIVVKPIHYTLRSVSKIFEKTKNETYK